MQTAKAILQLIRFPNLIFIGLTQWLCYDCIIRPALMAKASMPWQHVTLLIVSTILIAAAGYIINDYFDIKIDEINKPEKVIIEKIFKRRTIITWHILLNVIAMAIAGYLALKYVLLRVVILQLLIIISLIIYSTTLKRKLISGNLLISLLTTFTLICMALYEPKFKLFTLDDIYKYLFWLYCVFAFMITFIREVIKDAEDLKGDMMLQCKTIPLVWGIDGSKKIVYGLIFILLSIESFLFFYLENKTWIYILAFGTFLPIISLIPFLIKANTSKHFNQISAALKIITLLGILSMLFL
jgi:4-hydroxybenzoate polyprenyltransferase